MTLDMEHWRSVLRDEIADRKTGPHPVQPSEAELRVADADLPADFVCPPEGEDPLVDATFAMMLDELAAKRTGWERPVESITAEERAMMRRTLAYNIRKYGGPLA